MALELAEVRQALERSEVEPFFQPLVDLRTGRLAGFEVLARWRHPEQGFVLPENFIALAECNGLISALTQQVLRKTSPAASLFPAPLTLSINISPSQLQDLGLPEQIQGAAEQAGVALDRLTIEITESALVNNLPKAQSIARELKAMGCRLSLDDFGTGYSSLVQLQALPFDELKIDRSFVQSMTKTRESRKIVAAIAGLAHSLGLTAVAEGVETEEQADMLLWLGCELGQGWLYGRPIPLAGVPALVAAPPRAIAAGLTTPGDGWAVSSLEALPTQHLAQLQAIYDGSPVGLCFLDKSLRYVSVNQRLADSDGVPIAAHIGRTVEEVIPDLFPVMEPYLDRALKGEAVLDIEVSRPANKKEEDWTAMLSCQPAFDEADEVIGLSIAVADVTELKRTRQALLESDDRQRESLEHRNQVPWIMDSEGNNLYASARWVQTEDVSRRRTRNLGWLEALHPDDLEPTMKTMREALRTGKAIDIRYRVMGLDGDWRLMRSRGSPRFSPTGEIIRWYGSVEDIDPHRLIEEPESTGLDGVTFLQGDAGDLSPEM